MTVVSPLPTLPNNDETELDRSIILKIFSSIGRCRFLEEKHFDACTALSGSGPAFACIFLEAMTDGGVMMGLPRAEALELAAQSELLLGIRYYQTAETFTWSIALQGAARMTLQAGAHPAQIKDSVTSRFLFRWVSAGANNSCSSRRVHHRRAFSNGRRQSSVYDCSSNSNCDRARQRTRSTNEKIASTLSLYDLDRLYVNI